MKPIEETEKWFNTLVLDLMGGGADRLRIIDALGIGVLPYLPKLAEPLANAMAHRDGMARLQRLAGPHYDVRDLQCHSPRPQERQNVLCR